jgi:hypothetical protein
MGSLDLPLRETRPQLIQAARVRLASERQPELIARTFATLRPVSQGERTVRLFCAVMKGQQELDGDMLGEIRDMFRTSAQDPGLATSGGELIRALWNRALQDGPESPAATQLVDVLVSETGQDWCIGLLRELRGDQGRDTAMLLFMVLKAVVEVHPSAQFRKRLIDGLDELDHNVQWELERRIGDLPPGGIGALVVRAGRHNPPAALALARSALRNPAFASKQAALRSLFQFPTPAALEFLGRAAGAEGDAAARVALQAQQVDAAGLEALERTAVETLGATRTTEAVQSLVGVLFRQGNLGNLRMCTLAARALAINDTPEAQAALANGRRSPLPAVRQACTLSNP